MNWLATALVFSLLSWRVAAEIPVASEHIPNDASKNDFKFSKIQPPARNDAGTTAQFTLVDGLADQNGGTLTQLHDGRMPGGEDEPAANFFFRAGTDGGRISIDLGKSTHLTQVNTYSWHSDTRAPQLYVLYGSSGDSTDFKAEPKRGTDPANCGWKLLATVDSRPKEGAMGGQYAVCVGNSNAPIGEFRFLLFDIKQTENKDPFGNTFFSEIDVISANQTEALQFAGNEKLTKTFSAEQGKYEIVIDATTAPDLAEWAYKELVPVVVEWYPKLVKMLPSDGYEAPKRVTLSFSDRMGGTPAAAGGSRISLNSGWYRRNLKGEAKGAAVHELVHVVQQYGRARRTNPNATRAPGWLTEGIPDYIRWFRFEPETHGADISRKNIDRAKYDASYRITGNFLNWVSEKYDTNIVQKLNATIRDGKYTEGVWSNYTGRTVQDLGTEWKSHLTNLLAKPN